MRPLSSSMFEKLTVAMSNSISPSVRWLNSTCDPVPSKASDISPTSNSPPSDSASCRNSSSVPISKASDPEPSSARSISRFTSTRHAVVMSAATIARSHMRRMEDLSRLRPGTAAVSAPSRHIPSTGALSSRLWRRALLRPAAPARPMRSSRRSRCGRSRSRGWRGRGRREARCCRAGTR